LVKSVAYTAQLKNENSTNKNASII